jgi:hypothetical protein
MSLCEQCRAEIARPSEKMPEPWFDDDQKTIAGRHCEPMIWRLLQILWPRRGRYTSCDSLMTLLYASETDDPPHDAIIRVYMFRLRQALEPTPFAILCSTGHGYQLVDRSLVGPRVGAQADVDAPETGIPLPRLPKLPVSRDKYGLRAMLVGGSRVIRGVALDTLRAALHGTAQRGLGTFRAGYDDDGTMRIWRVE